MPAFSFTLNGASTTVTAAADEPLLWVLRDLLGVTGPKYGCGVGVCKACTSHLDGAAFNPCITPVSECAGRAVTTIEGLANGATLHPVQQAWIDEDVAQCGFCQPGQIMAAAALLASNAHPTDADIDLLENVCRCGTYVRIRKAIHRAAG
jgi:isoquinoline 1-oxidoreductase alpha subunit